MLLSKQALVCVWTFFLAINVDGALIRKTETDIVKEFSNIVVDKTANRLQIVEHDVRFEDKADFYNSRDDNVKLNSGARSDTSNEISDEYFTNKNKQRNKRQAEFSEITQGADPSGDIQGIWENMTKVIVEGAKQIVRKVADSFDVDPEQQEMLN